MKHEFGMNKEYKEKWLKALRSGYYKQANGCLHNSEGAYCCLGVLANIAKKEVGGYWEQEEGRSRGNYGFMIKSRAGLVEEELLPEPLRKLVGFGSNANPEVIGPQGETTTLADLNDAGLGFGAIANIIEEQL